MTRDALRLFVTVAFAFCLLLLYQDWEEFSRPKNVYEDELETGVSATSREDLLAAEKSSQQTPNTDLSAQDEALPQVTQRLDGSAGDDELPAVANEQPPAEASSAPNEIVAEIENDTVRASFDTKGNLVRLELLRHLVEVDGPPLRLFMLSGGHRFAPQSGLLGEGLPSHLDDGWRLGLVDKQSRSVQSVWSGGGIEVVATYTLDESGYVIDLNHTLSNGRAEPLDGHIYYQFLRDSEAPASYSAKIPSFYGAAIYTSEDKYNKYDYDEFEDYPRSSNDGWIALVQRYFMAAWLDPGTIREFFMRNLANEDLAVGMIRPLPQIGPGETVGIEQKLYAGALENSQLRNIDESLGENLKLTIDYGWLSILAAPLFTLLALIDMFSGNWGISIIVLTLLIKLAFFPLSAKSYRSMARLKNVSPQMQKLKEKCGDDRQKFQKEMMELYKKEKINPLGGCLPILIQIPVFIALYWMLLEAVELRQAPLGLWIQDLSSPDPWFVLPVLLGVTMYGQFKLNPTPTDPTQAMIMKVMPLGFAAFSIIMPSGLVLYWITNTLLSIAQQWQITRSLANPQPKAKPKAKS